MAAPAIVAAISGQGRRRERATIVSEYRDRAVRHNGAEHAAGDERGGDHAIWPIACLDRTASR
jgi:hypothetical protein